tara:strand:+ start:344 stop:979 length:636 start_codon:yes stop_codon:yes gene_type:complete
MFDLYTWTTPNGRKVSILLEELKIDYNIISIDIDKGDQFSEKFQSISVDNKIPIIFDYEKKVYIKESGIILIYLAEKYKKFIPSDENRFDTLQWLMWQMSALGPICGQAHHFLYYNPGKSEYSENRFKKNTENLYKILNNRLEKFQYVSGANNGEYTIADIAIWPWIARHKRHQINLNDYPGVLRWYKEIYDRPAVQKGYHIPHFEEEIPL